MRIRLLIFILLALISYPAFSDEKEGKAFNAVKEMGLGNNLGQLGYQAALVTQTYKSVVYQVGEDKAQRLIKKELALAIPKYQDKWDHNLTSTYLEYFSADELQSLAKEKGNSPYVQKFVTQRGQVGQSMQDKSKELLISMVSEVILGAFQTVNHNCKIDPKTTKADCSESIFN